MNLEANPNAKYEKFLVDIKDLGVWNAEELTLPNGASILCVRINFAYSISPA